MRADIRYDLLDLGSTFKAGFFSDGVVRAIQSYKLSSITPASGSIERKQLQKAYEFLEMVEAGEEQVNTGRLQSNAVNSIVAYRRSLSAFKYHPTSDRDFKSFIAAMKRNIGSILNEGEISQQQIELIERFFKVISMSTFIETEQLLEKREGLPRWMPGSMML